MYLGFEFKEKSLLKKNSPYSTSNIDDAGLKALHLFFPISLGLMELKEWNNINNYKQVYLKLASIIQILDDIGDLEEDLTNGHYSIPLLIYTDDLQTIKEMKDYKDLKRNMLADNEYRNKIKIILLKQIADSEKILDNIKAEILPFKYVTQLLKTRLLLIP